ncbi:Disease resistance RPP8-like protein 3 [Forsythia ovata]|uniref:Disease resistance RPP8-like protein 3 n=1 Tax=Forsythia ovata TaxID=205694 RepID=A0ABD1U5I8_9LAMI
MAYAALLSLKHLLEHTLDHDYQYLFLNEKPQIESLLQKLCFLQDFLDHSPQKISETIDCLESQIIDAAYEVEDIIESHITDRVRKEIARGYSLTPFCLKLEEVIEEIDSIKKRVEKIKDENDIQDLQTRTEPSPDSLKQPASSSGKSSMVGLDDDIMKIKEWLTAEVLSNLETLSVVGMGGIGKTTLTRKVYDDGFSVYRFHIRAWVSVSQEYNERELLLELLDSMKKPTDKLREKSFEQLAEYLYKTLKGTRYLIVLDDMWDTKVWDKVKRSFPNDRNGSRIMVTTRLENVGCYANSRSTLYHMRFLNEGESWNLFCENVFGKDGCPTELNQIGKKIVQNCQGLPLAIVVIAGLLSKATKTQHDWSNIGENLSSVIASNDDNCLKILSLSYKHLPHHLKGCFLYIGIFPEDYDISVSELVKLWVAERLLKPVRSKSLEDVAWEYLLELVDRNLILVHKKSSIGKIKTCRIHDLLRYFCVREAQRVNFFHVKNQGLCGISEGTKVRRLRIRSHRKLHDLDNCLQNMCLRSVLNFDLENNLSSEIIINSFGLEYNLSSKKLRNSRLLSVFDTSNTSINEFPVNLRYFACKMKVVISFPASLLYPLRNLQILICRNGISEISEIWEMRQLRHVKFREMVLPAPPPSAGNLSVCRLSSVTHSVHPFCTTSIFQKSIIVLDNLQTLSNVVNFRCTEEVLRRIPNLKKLGIFFYPRVVLDNRYYCLNNLARLHKLESLNLSSGDSYLRTTTIFENWSRRSSLKNIAFPISLKKLSLSGCCLPWEDMTIVGSLPNLQVLKLFSDSFIGLEWEPNEREFLQLKYLRLDRINLQNWIANNIHFPSLEHLVIKYCGSLKEIPSGIGEIPTLESIEVSGCNDSVVTSAKQIQEEQHGSGNDYLQVRIFTWFGKLFEV